jgi:hypothetical protein
VNILAYSDIYTDAYLSLAYAEPETEVEVMYFGEGETAVVTAEPLFVKEQAQLKA